MTLLTSTLLTRIGSTRKEADLIFIINDTHIGKTSSTIDFRAECDKFFTWFFDEVRKIHGEHVLIVAGDFFDTKRSLTVDQHEQAENVFQQIESVFKEAYFILGNHDISGQSKLDKHLFKMFVLPNNFHVITYPQMFIVDGHSIGMYPFGTFDDRLHADINITHQVINHDLSVSTVLNGHIHTPGRVGDYIFNLGSPYAMDWSEHENPGGFHTLLSDLTAMRNPYPRKIYKRVVIENGKVEGKNPVKWITENRKDLEGIALEVIVPEDVDKTLYSKFQGVLRTVKFADLKMTEIISFDENTVLAEKTMTIFESIENLLQREGAKDKVKQVITEVSK